MQAQEFIRETVSKVAEFISPAQSRPTTATKLLKEQHCQLEALFDEFESMGSRAVVAKQTLLCQLTDLLSGHMLIEESLFYPAMARLDPSMVFACEEEHSNAKATLERLSRSDVSSVELAAKMKVLQQTMMHHVREEETRLFPVADENLSESEQASLCEDMQAMLSHARRQHAPVAALAMRPKRKASAPAARKKKSDPKTAKTKRVERKARR